MLLALLKTTINFSKTNKTRSTLIESQPKKVVVGVVAVVVVVVVVFVVVGLIVGVFAGVVVIVIIVGHRYNDTNISGSSTSTSVIK